MIPQRPTIERRLFDALNDTPSRIPVLVGGCGTGRTTLLLRMSQLFSEYETHYLDIERAASTPEKFYGSVTKNSPYIMSTYQSEFASQQQSTSPEFENARAAFDALLQFFSRATSPDGNTPIFLMDEFLELRSFENFPGLRGVQDELIEALSKTSNRFVLTTRYTTRAHRLLREAPDRFEVIHIPPLTPAEVSKVLTLREVGQDDSERSDLGRMIHVLTDGRPVYVDAIARALHSMDGASSGDPVSALASQLSVHAHLALSCRFSYELRLHRARGYGALKAILQILSEEEPLTLTEIAHRLSRTPGSTKDYLTWLEDVDLVSVRQKRYSFVDPLLRLWVRLHCKPTPPSDSDLSREVQEYAVTRLPYMESMSDESDSPTNLPVSEKKKEWSIIEID